MKYATDNFVNRQSAIHHYSKDGYEEEDIDEMITNGAITIGKPKVEDDEYITTENGRYFINELSS